MQAHRLIQALTVWYSALFIQILSLASKLPFIAFQEGIKQRWH